MPYVSSHTVCEPRTDLTAERRYPSRHRSVPGGILAPGNDEGRWKVKYGAEIVGQISIRDYLRQPVALHNPILNTALNPGRPALVCNSAFQFPRERLRVAINPFE